MFSSARCAAAIACGALMLLSGCSSIKVDTFPISDSRIHKTMLTSLEDKKRIDIVMTAMSTIGKPYRWGGQQMQEGFDCSGLVFYAYTQNGVHEHEMPRVTTQLAKNSRPIKRSELKPGDLVFFNTLGQRYSHVGLYMGEGRFINAPSKGKLVRIDSMDSPYYKKRFTGARRLHLISDELVAGARQDRSAGRG